MKSLPQLLSSPVSSVPSCLDRRAFLTNTSLLAVGALLASACGNGTIGGGITDIGTVGVTVKLSDYPALATVGGIARLNGTASPIAVVREAVAEYRAFSMVCPHQGTTIGINGTGFLCPNHEARFSGTGKWLGGQVTSSLREFAVTSNTTSGTLSISS